MKQLGKNQHLRWATGNDRNTGSAMLGTIILFGIIAVVMAILGEQNVRLFSFAKKKAQENDLKDIRNNFELLIDCPALQATMTTSAACGLDTPPESRFFSLRKVDGTEAIRSPLSGGYTVFANRYLLSAVCHPTGKILIAVAALKKDQKAPQFSFEGHKALTWNNLFPGKESVCGELPYFRENVDAEGYLQ